MVLLIKDADVVNVSIVQHDNFLTNIYGYINSCIVVHNTIILNIYEMNLQIRDKWLSEGTGE
jgi:hypothetical protein